MEAGTAGEAGPAGEAGTAGELGGVSVLAGDVVTGVATGVAVTAVSARSAGLGVAGGVKTKLEGVGPGVLTGLPPGLAVTPVQ